MPQDIAEPKPHISVSQLTCFLICPLRYKFRYVEELTPERLAPALPFGKAMHKALSYLFQCQKYGVDCPLESVGQVFLEAWEEVCNSAVKDIITFEDGQREKLEAQGVELVNLVHREATAEQIVVEEVEEEFRVPIINPVTGEIIEGYELVGIFDLIRRGEPNPANGAGGVIVDHKTASSVFDKVKVEMDLQMTAYSLAYRLWFNRPEEALEFRLMVKTQKPKLQRIKTHRTQREHTWLFHLIKRVLAVKEQGLFYPSPGWQCKECEFRSACREWQGK